MMRVAIRRQLLLELVVVAAVIATLLLVLLGWSPSEAAVRAVYARDVPVGAPAKQVEAVLQREGVEFSWDEPTRTYYAMYRGHFGVVKRNVWVRIHMADDAGASSVETGTYVYGP